MKDIKNIIRISIFITILLIINTKNTKAAMVTNDPTANTNSTVSITVSSPNGLNSYNVYLVDSGGLTFSSATAPAGAIKDGSSIGYANLAEAKTNLGTYTFKTPSTPGTYKVIFKDQNGVENTSIVTVTNQNNASTTGGTTTPNTSSNSGSNTNTPAAKSNVTTLSNLGIRPNDFSGFRAAKTSYSTEVPNDVESIEIYANKGQNGQTITGTGKKTLQEGTNTFNIVVTAEDGTSKKTYTLTVNRKAKDDTNNTTENSTINDDAIDNEISNEMDNTNEFENNIIEDNEAGNVVGNNNSNLQKENTIIIAIIAIIAVIIIIIIIILIVEAIKKKRMKGEDDDEYQDIYDDNENNEINDFDTSSVPVALQGNEDKIENPKEEEKENKIDENLNSTIIQEPEENKEIEASEPKLDNEEPKKELKEMFEDEERPRRKGHSKGKRFK